MRSLSLIVVLVATGLLMAACGGSAKKDAQAPTSSTPTSTPNSSQGGVKSDGKGTAKAGDVAEAGTGTPLQARGLAQALSSLKSSLVQKGTLNKQPSSSASFGGIDGTATGSDSNLRRGPSPAQSLSQLGAMLRSELSGTSKVPAHSNLPAVQGAALQLTSSAQLRRRIPQASAFRAMSSYAADSARLRTKVAAGTQTLNAKLGNAVAGSAGALSKQSLTPAKALGSLGGLARRGADGVSKLKQPQGQASVDGNAGALQEGAAAAVVRRAPNAAQTLAALTPKTSVANKQAAGTQSVDSGGGVATGEPTRSTPANKALGQIRER
jgi:hypothetical protein